MFDIEIDSTDLADAIKYVSKTIGESSVGKNLECISCIDTGNFTLQVCTNSIKESSIIEVVLIRGSSNGPEQMPIVDFKRFNSIVSTIPSGVTVKIQGDNANNIVNISYGNKKPIKLVSTASSFIAPVNNNSLNPAGINLSPVAVIDTDILTDALFNISKILKEDITNPMANCIRIETSNNTDVEITAIDAMNNRSYYRKDTNSDINSNSVIVLEAIKLAKVIDMFGSFPQIEISQDNNSVSLRGFGAIRPNSKNTNITESIYNASKRNGTFPPQIKNFFVGKAVEYAVVNKSDFETSLLQAMALDDGSMSRDCINISIENSSCTLSKTSAYGSMEVDSKLNNAISYKLADTFKAKVLLDVIKSFDSQSDKFEIAQCSSSNNNSYYLLRDSGISKNNFMITGFINKNTP